MRRRRLLAAGLAVLGVGWALVNGPVEGPVLWTVTAHHGLTVSDLVSVALLAAAGWLALARRGRGRRAASDERSG